MNYYYITFRSVTFAQRAERLLGGNGVRCTLQRTPRWMEEQGCGYALRIWTKNIAAVQELLKQGKIPMRRTYRQKGEGLMEEVEQT